MFGEHDKIVNEIIPHAQPGKVEGLVRLGPAADPWTVRQMTFGRHLIPGAAMKFFRSGMASGDVLFGGPGGPAASIPNQNYNFFAVSQSNAFDPINSKYDLQLSFPQYRIISFLINRRRGI